MAGPFNIAIKAVLKQLGKGSARAVPKDIMSGTIRRIKQEAPLPETPSRVFGKDPERYTGPHSDFVSPKRKEGLEAIGETEIKSFKDKYFRGDDKTRYRSSRLEEQARSLDEGVITLDEFKEIRDVIKPLKTYGRVPPLNKQVDEAGELISPDKFDPIEIVGPIGKTRVDNSGIIGFNKFIKEGERATSRFDIDAYNHYDRYIPVIQTLVDKVTKATGKITKKFAKKGYSPTAVLTNVTFNYDPKKAFSIAKGRRGVSSEGKEYPLGEDIKLKKGDTKLGEKEPFATMEGNWKNLTPEEAHRYAKEKIGTEGWTEVGFDPAARQSFYNRATGEPVFKADEVIQVGAMLLARGLRKATPKQLESLKIITKAGKEITYKQGGQVSEGLSSIVSRANGGKTDKRWNFATPGTLEWQETLDRHADRLLEDEERRYSGQESRTLNPDFYTDEARTFNNPVYDLFGDPTEWFGNKEKTRQEYYQELKDVLGYDREESERQWNLAGQGFKRVQDSQGRIRVTRPNPRHISRSERDDGISSSSPQTDHTLFGLEGYSEVTDPSSGVTTSFIDDVAIDTASGLKHGGQTMAGGLSGIKKTININGQPHSLAWINPGEASVLKAMGGSGKKVEGVPAYYYDDPGSMQSYLDEADAADVGAETEYLTDDGGTTTDRSEATGLTSPVTFMNLEEADLTSEEGAGLGKMYRQYIQDKIKQLREGREGEGREYEKALALEAIQAEIPGSTDPWDLEKFAKDYPALAPLGWAVKGAGWLASLDKNPVVSQVNMGGKIYDIRMDGTMTEKKEEEDYGDDGPDPIKKKKLLPPPVASAAPVEKELTGMEKYYSELPKTTPRKASNVHLSALLDQIYGEGQGQQLLG